MTKSKTGDMPPPTGGGGQLPATIDTKKLTQVATDVAVAILGLMCDKQQRGAETNLAPCQEREAISRATGRDIAAQCWKLNLSEAAARALIKAVREIAAEDEDIGRQLVHGIKSWLHSKQPL